MSLLRPGRRVAPGLLVGWLLAVALPAGAEELRVGYSAITANQAPLWVTREAGLFEKNGLAVTLSFIEGGSKATQALLAGDVPIVQVGGSAVVQSRLAGSDAVMILGAFNTLNFKVVAAPEITDPRQLKGKTLGVSRFGSSNDFAARFMLEHFGLAPDRDVPILQIGAEPARFAALKAGSIQATLVEVPTTLMAKKLGFNIIADLGELGLEYQHTGIATTRAFIQKQADTVRRFVKAYVEGIHYYKTRKAESLAVIARYLKSADREAIEEAYTEIGLKRTPRKPYPTLKGLQLIIDEAGEKNPRALSLKPEAVVDVRFLKELDESGAIDRLYR